jgi:hypothetical protein
MKCEIDNESVSPKIMFFRELGFGEGMCTTLLHDYRLVFTRNEFLQLMGEAYDDLLRDQKADDELTGNPQPQYFNQLDYPTLAELMQYPVYFADAVRHYLWNDVFLACFTGERAFWKWIVNSIDSVAVEDEEIVIAGKAYERPAVTEHFSRSQDAP